MRHDPRFRHRAKGGAIGEVFKAHFDREIGIAISVGNLDEDYEWMSGILKPHEIERFILALWKAYQEYIAVDGRYVEFGNCGLSVEGCTKSERIQPSGDTITNGA